MSLPMAIVDYIPVILFLMAAMTLLHDLYHMMSKGAFALLAAGQIVISVAGFYKATWKLLYALNIRICRRNMVIATDRNDNGMISTDVMCEDRNAVLLPISGRNQTNSVEKLPAVTKIF